MKTKLLAILTIFLFANITIKAQETIEVKKTSAELTCDGLDDEPVWGVIPKNYLELDYQEEVPTIDSAYWRAVWTDDALWIIVNVFDDEHNPAWEVPDGKPYQCDQVELFFDCDNNKSDMGGPRDKTGSEYQVATEYEEVKYGIADLEYVFTDDIHLPMAYYAYTLEGENIIQEYKIPYSSLKGTGDELTAESIVNKEIGFEVVLNDRDENKTTRDRKVWSNADGTSGDANDNGDSYRDMDPTGSLKIVSDEIDLTVSVNHLNTKQFKVYPNPASSILNITDIAKNKKVTLINIVGKKMYSAISTDTSLNIDISDYEKGIYLLRIENKTLRVVLK